MGNNIKKKIIFIAHGLDENNKYLQPWRYILEIIKKHKEYFNVYVITDGPADYQNKYIDDIEIISTSRLSIKRQICLLKLINQISPDLIWWSLTPRSIAYFPIIKKIEQKIVGLITCPIYDWNVFLKAHLKGKVPFKEMQSLIMQRMIPRIIFGRFLEISKFATIVTQSESNKRALLKFSKINSKVDLLPVGLDLNELASIKKNISFDIRARYKIDKEKHIYLYLGAVRRIRGYHALIEAYGNASKDNPNNHLVILARGADEVFVKKINEDIKARNISKTITVVGGWLDRITLWNHVKSCDCVVLPFVIVPSDVPIAVLEALMCGKPVIGSNIDGIPELIDGRGWIIDPLDKYQFSNILANMHFKNKDYESRANQAIQFAKSHPSWDLVTDNAVNISSTILTKL